MSSIATTKSARRAFQRSRGRSASCAHTLNTEEEGYPFWGTCRGACASSIAIYKNVVRTNAATDVRSRCEYANRAGVGAAHERRSNVGINTSIQDDSELIAYRHPGQAPALLAHT